MEVSTERTVEIWVSHALIQFVYGQIVLPAICGIAFVTPPERFVHSVIGVRERADDLAEAADIDGFLVGGASLKPEFIDICKSGSA